MRLLRAATLSLAAALPSGCTALGTFNALVPKDPARTLARDVAYGPHPRQSLDVYAPKAEGPHPVLVFVHGGSWSSGDKSGYAWAGRALACRGFVTVVPNYRLVPEVRYPDFVSDTAAAIAWAYREAAGYGGDPERLAVMGHSAGAYNAVQASFAPEFLRAEGVDGGTVKAVVSLSGPVDFLPLDTDSSIAAFGNVPADALPATQPVNRAETPPPTLAIHGTADETVKPRHAPALVGAVRAAGSEARLLLYDGVDHRGVVLGLSRPFRGRVPTLEDATGFLRDTVGGTGDAC